MLIKYKKSNEKIAMGLLSFMQDKPDLPKLQKTLERYGQDPDWQLYLWKQDEDVIGAIGIEIAEYTFTVHDIAVNPSFRNEGIGLAMVEKLQQLHEPLALCSTPATKEFLEKCWNASV
ncbi:GNAT family N-acetyltransferase [Planococcus sp. FY231025]|uniref:GNAT family N-acetyltransferase n=1 Tax=Planococcus sp. FY231025 TaxID=3455699 RepID=UPI003F928C07